ncbi:hypothetical protein ACFX15_014747 [Malus domestica]
MCLCSSRAVESAGARASCRMENASEISYNPSRSGSEGRTAPGRVGIELESSKLRLFPENRHHRMRF